MHVEGGLLGKHNGHYSWHYFCQAQPQLQVKLSLKAELVLLTFPLVIFLLMMIVADLPGLYVWGQ